MPLNTELVARILKPIAGDSPSGADLRYDPRVDAIKEARREDLDLPGVTNRKLADWPAVINGSTALLADETKDLQLASWLTEALLNKNGYSGLATGLEALRGLMETFWDTMHPELEDDDAELRIGPLDWVGGRLTVPLQMVPLGASGVTYLDVTTSRSIPSEDEADSDADKRTMRADAIAQGKQTPEQIESGLDKLNKTALRAIIADIDEAMTVLAALEKLSDERFGRDAPSFLPMRKSLDETKRYLAGLVTIRLETDPDPEIPIEEAEAALAEAGGDEVLTVEPTSAADAARRVAVIAKWLRQQDPTNPAPYTMLRGFRWGELRADVNELNPKLLDAPPTATRAKLKGMLLDGKWVELIENAEALMATASGRGWLDLQRYVLTACAELGGSHDAVAAAIRSELRSLLAALPQLPRMTLMDDTPTANEETRKWIDDEGLASADAEETPAGGDATDEGAEAAADVEPSDGAEVLAEALEDDTSSAHQGGFVKTRSVRRARPPRGGDAFDMARNEVLAGRPNRAIEILMKDLSREQSPRGRFVRQTQIAYVMVDAGLDVVALPILQSLVATIDERGLEQWESGALVAQPMALLCKVFDRTGMGESEREELYLRVCRLDPLQAMALQSR
jgi:type VI secretion system protein ImpA